MLNLALEMFIKRDKVSCFPNMIVIGFNWPIEHDNAVAVIQDGKLVFAAEEERFTRHKHSPFEPPINALRQAFIFLKKRGIKPKDVDAYAVNHAPWLYNYRTRLFVFGSTYLRSFIHGLVKKMKA